MDLFSLFSLNCWNLGIGNAFIEIVNVGTGEWKVFGMINKWGVQMSTGG